MNYPSLPYATNLKITADSGRVFARALSGATRGRDTYNRVKYTLEIEHTWLKPDQFAELLACYEAAGTDRVIFTDLKTSIQYSAIFENEPSITDRVGTWVKVEVTLKEGEKV